MKAARTGNAQMVKMLLDHGADPTFVAKNGSISQ